MFLSPCCPGPIARVLDWLDAQVAETLYLSTVSLAELLFGVEILPAGKRHKALAFSLPEKIMALFGERIVPLISPPPRPMRKSSFAPAVVAIPSAWPMPKSRRWPQLAGSAWRLATKHRLMLPAFPSSTRGRQVTHRSESTPGNLGTERYKVLLCPCRAWGHPNAKKIISTAFRLTHTP